ncbi:hypothetical protein, partial [Bacillus licheniformis]
LKNKTVYFQRGHYISFEVLTMNTGIHLLSSIEFLIEMSLLLLLSKMKWKPFIAITERDYATKKANKMRLQAAAFLV